MKLSQRLWNESTCKSFYDDVLALLKEHPGSCDDVWLTTAVGYPSKQAHKEYAEELIEVAEKFRAEGISVSLQVANTLGHGLYMCAQDCTGLVYDGSPAEKMVGADGVEAAYSFCPRGKHFRAYICETLSYYAPIRPDILWVDDDFRLPNHKPVAFGCFCEGCLAAFNAQYGASFSREALVQEILYAKDLTWRRRYLRFQREGMRELMEAIIQGFSALSPDTVGGLQHAAPGGYIMGDHEFGFEPMLRLTGKNPVSRPGGGAYNDHTPHRFIEKGIDVAFQNARLPQYVKDVYPEVENIPHYAYGKSAEGTALESAYYLACGANHMSYSMLKYAEPISYYSKFLQLFAAQRPYWERLAAANEKSLPAGLCYFVSRNAWQREVAPGEGLSRLHGGSPTGADRFFRDAIPIVFDERCDNVYLLHPSEAERLCAQDIEYLLTQRVITDAESVAMLLARGVALGVEVRMLSELEGFPLYETYTNHVLNAGCKEWKSSYFSGGKKESGSFLVHTGTAEILGTYAASVPQKPLFEGTENPLGVAELILKTPQGGKWALLGYQPWKGTVSKARRDRFLDLADYIAKTPLPARVITPHQVILHPRVEESGKTVCVSVTNCSIGKCEGAELLIRAPKGTRFRFLSQYLPPQLLQARREGDAYVLSLPTLDAWTQGSVFCEE